MKYGNKVEVEVRKDGENYEVSLLNIKKGIDITGKDFYKNLVREDGYIKKDIGEIDVVQGIEDEKTTGEDIRFIFKSKDIGKGFLLCGTVIEKVFGEQVDVELFDLGGITFHEKNLSYIETLTQRLKLDKDSVGGSIVCHLLDRDIDLKNIKKDISTLLFSVYENISAIEFEEGVAGNKKQRSETRENLSRVKVTFLPDDSEDPSTIFSAEKVVKAIINLVVVNNK